MVATKDLSEKSARNKAPNKEHMTNDPAAAAVTLGNPPEQGTKIEAQAPQGIERTRTGRLYTPAVDIYETTDAVILVADMPGVDDKSVDVTIEKNVLTIYGHVQPPEYEGYNLAYSEYGIGDYLRSFTIGNTIDWERIEGTVKAGVLRLIMPKAGPAQAKKIQIKAQ